MLVGANAADVSNLIGAGNPNAAAMPYIFPRSPAIRASFRRRTTCGDSKCCAISTRRPAAAVADVDRDQGSLNLGDHHHAATPAVTGAVQTAMAAGDAVDAAEEQACLVEAGRSGHAACRASAAPAAEAVAFKPQPGAFDMQARRVHCFV
jgi:hypothetical protein